jgi:hypothetical protein
LWSLPYSLFLMESHAIQSLNSFCTCISGIWWQFLSADQQRTLSYENSSLFYALWSIKVNIFVHGVDDSVPTSFAYSICKKMFLAIVNNTKTALYSMPSGQLRLTYLYTALMILCVLALLTAFAKKCFWPLCMTYTTFLCNLLLTIFTHDKYYICILWHHHSVHVMKWRLPTH